MSEVGTNDFSFIEHIFVLLKKSLDIWSSFYLRKSALRISPTFKFVFFPVTKLGIFFMITSSSAVIHFVSAKV